MTTLPAPDFDMLTDAEKARLLAELNAKFDAQLASLNAPGAAEKFDELMRKPLRLNGRVKVGEVPTEAEKTGAIAELSAQVDAQLACLNEPGAAAKIDEFMRKPLRLYGRVKAGDN